MITLHFSPKIQIYNLYH